MRRLPRTACGVGRSARPTKCRGALTEILRRRSSINPFFLVRLKHVENRRGLAEHMFSEETNGSIRGYPSLERMRAAVAVPANKLEVQGPWTVVLLPGLELCMTAHRRDANRRRFSTATRLHC